MVRRKKESQLETPVVKKVLARGVPDYDFQFGLIRFDRNIRPISDRSQEDDAVAGNADASDAESFHGTGFSMKKTRK